MVEVSFLKSVEVKGHVHYLVQKPCNFLQPCWSTESRNNIPRSCTTGIEAHCWNLL